MEIFILCLLGYFLVSPDKGSLMLSRGVFGAGRGLVTGKSPKAKKPSPRLPAMTAGWREGIEIARKRRADGKDTWTRGTRVAGRVGGGTASLARGIHGTVQALRGREEVEELDSPETSTSPDSGSEAKPSPPAADPTTSPDARPATRGWKMPRMVRRPRTAPTSDASGRTVDQDGNDITGPTTPPDAAEPPKESAGPAVPRADEADLELARLKEEAKRTEDILTVLRGPLHGTAGDLTGDGMTDDEAEERARRIATGEGEEAAAARRLVKHVDTIRAKRDAANVEIAKREGPPEPVVVEPAVVAPVVDSTPAPTPDPTSAPAVTHTTPNGDIAMPTANELTGIDALDAEIKTSQNAFSDLSEAVAKYQKHVKGIPGRLSEAAWGTKGLDRTVMALAEEVGGIKLPNLESFAAVRTEIVKARALGATAAANQARGKIEGFVPN